MVRPMPSATHPKRLPKIIEHYRHAKRTKPSPHINEEGVRIARRIGDNLPRFDLVVTSMKKRSIETAVAMGFAVEKTAKILSDLPDFLEAQIAHSAGFEAFAKLAEKDARVRDYLQKLREFTYSQLEKVPDGGRILMVSHGGLVEWCALACYPSAADWGKALDKCEGVRLVFDGMECTEAAPFRIR
jgi:broad specificity phosphatase PhoE